MNTSVGTSNTANEVIPLSFLFFTSSFLPCDKNFAKGGKKIWRESAFFQPSNFRVRNEFVERCEGGSCERWLGDKSWAAVRAASLPRSHALTDDPLDRRFHPKLSDYSVGLAENGGSPREERGRRGARRRRDTSATVGGGYARGRATPPKLRRKADTNRATSWKLNSIRTKFNPLSILLFLHSPISTLCHSIGKSR